MIGGTRTIESQVYAKQLADLAISQKVAQPLSALVERGNHNGCEAEYAVRDIFENMGNDVVLACTHYVAMTQLIGELFPELRCHDPIPFIVERFLDQWGEFQQGPDLFITTGDLAESQYAAQMAFGVAAVFEKVEL